MRWQSDPPAAQVLSGVFDTDPPPHDHVEDYWSCLIPHLKTFGISRVADITGLDRVGFPVVQVVRPMARSNAVTQGKGSSLAIAAIGAVLECLEMAAGEAPERLVPSIRGDPNLWGPIAPGLSAGQSWPDAQTKYIEGWNIQNNCSEAIPADLISTDYSVGAEAESAPVLRQSVGLGAGGSLSAAVAHGLLECVEADARIRYEATGRATRLSIDPKDSRFGLLVRQIDNAGLRVAVHQMPSGTQAPCIVASVMEPPGAISLPLPAKGYAARLEVGDAIFAAIAEAVQARLAVISGAREDITHRFYSHDYTMSELEAEWRRHGKAVSEDLAVPTIPLGLSELMSKTGPVFGVPLHLDPNIPLAIVRVIAPGLITDPLRLGGLA